MLFDALWTSHSKNCICSPNEGTYDCTAGFEHLPAENHELMKVFVFHESDQNTQGKRRADEHGTPN